MLAAHAQELKRRFGHVRAGWEREEKLHLTLKFVGEAEPTRADALRRAAGPAASGVAPFALALADTGAFPPRGLPRVLWAGVRDDAGALRLLQQRLEDECAAEGFARERRPFHPHLTLARLRDASAGARELGEAHRASSLPPAAFRVAELCVVRSVLGPGGSRYTTLSRHALGATRTD